VVRGQAVGALQLRQELRLVALALGALALERGVALRARPAAQRVLLQRRFDVRDLLHHPVEARLLLVRLALPRGVPLRALLHLALGPRVWRRLARRGLLLAAAPQGVKILLLLPALAGLPLLLQLHRSVQPLRHLNLRV